MAKAVLTAFILALTVIGVYEEDALLSVVTGGRSRSGNEKSRE